MTKNPKKSVNFSNLLLRAVENVANGIVISDPNQKDNPIIFVNKAFCELTGYSEEEVLGRNCRFLQGTENNQSELKKLRKALKQKKEIYVVLKNFKKDGTMFWNELHITPVFDDSGELVNFIGVQNDITQEKIAQDELLKYKEYLKKTVNQRTKELVDSNEQLRKEVQERQKAQEKISLLYNRINESAKKLEVKLKKSDEERIKLTKKEIKAFIGLVKHPNLTLEKLSKNINLPVSTINAVKNRLFKEEYYEKINLPRFETFSNYLLSVVYYDGLIDSERKYSKPEIEKAFSNSSVVYAKYSEKLGAYILLTKDWTEFKEINSKISSKLKIDKENFNTVNTVHFPLEKTTFQKFFDYEGYLHKLFEVEAVPEQQKKFNFIKKFNEAEKKIFYGLTKYPGFTLEKLSKRIEVSKPTISKYASQLKKKGALKLVNKPIYTKVRVHLFVLKHYHFSVAENNDFEPQKNNDFLSFTTNTDHISISLHKDYADLQDESNNVANQRKIIGEPFKLIIPIEGIKYKKVDFSSALRKMLFN